LDGALIATEIVHWMQKQRKVGIFRKLDFQKAYDTIYWTSMDIVLKEL